MDSQLTVRLPRDLSQALENAKHHTGLKSSEIVRLALRGYLHVPAGPNNRPAERVRTLIGALESGLPDLAEKHREYILESLRNGG